MKNLEKKSVGLSELYLEDLCKGVHFQRLTTKINTKTNTKPKTPKSF